MRRKTAGPLVSTADTDSSAIALADPVVQKFLKITLSAAARPKAETAPVGSKANRNSTAAPAESSAEQHAIDAAARFRTRFSELRAGGRSEADAHRVAWADAESFARSFAPASA
jgi:hypothetical protein